MQQLFEHFRILDSLLVSWPKTLLGAPECFISPKPQSLLPASHLNRWQGSPFCRLLSFIKTTLKKFSGAKGPNGGKEAKRGQRAIQMRRKRKKVLLSQARKLLNSEKYSPTHRTYSKVLPVAVYNYFLFEKFFVPFCFILVDFFCCFVLCPPASLGPLPPWVFLCVLCILYQLLVFPQFFVLRPPPPL